MWSRLIYLTDSVSQLVSIRIVVDGFSAIIGRTAMNFPAFAKTTRQNVAR